MDDAYQLVMSAPALDDYLRLRREAGLTPKSEAQGALALTGSWVFCRVCDSDGRTVAMGRAIGDGGWYFHIADMAVLPEHQRKGIGDAILTALLDHIIKAAPPGPHVTLLADRPGRRLYERHGFVPTGPDSIGMQLSR